MYEKLTDKTEQFIGNYQILQQEWKKERNAMVAAAAMIFVEQERTADPDRLELCSQIVKKDTGILSVYRGTVRPILLANMSLSQDPEGYLESVKKLVDSFSEKHIFDNSFAVPAAITLLECISPGYIDVYVRQAKEIFSLLREKYPNLTGKEDLPHSVMLAVADADPNLLLADAGACFEILKGFSGKDELQALCLTLSLSNMPPQEKCDKVLDIFRILKETGHEYGKSYEITSLGALMVLEKSAEELADRIGHADDLLVKVKGLGSMGLGTAGRRMIAASLVLETDVKCSVCAVSDRAAEVISSVNLSTAEMTMTKYLSSMATAFAVEP